MAIIRRISQKHEVRYQVKVRDSIGRWFPSETFPTKAQAEAHERQLLGQRDQGDMALAPSQREQTVKHIYSLIHKLFEDAVEHCGWLARNPALGRYRPKVPRRERAFLTPQESQRLLAFAQSHYLGPAIYLQILAGLRPSEVQALTWSSVDFERGVILIRAAFNNKEGRLQEHPKQDDWGMAPIPPQLGVFLTDLKAKRRERAEACVVQNVAGSGAMLPYETYLTRDSIRSQAKSDRSLGRYRGNPNPLSRDRDCGSY